MRRTVILGVTLTIINIGIWTSIADDNNKAVKGLENREKGIALIDEGKKKDENGSVIIENCWEAEGFLEEYFKYSKGDVRVEKLMEEYKIMDEFNGLEVTKENFKEKEKKGERLSKSESSANRLMGYEYLGLITQKKQELGISEENK